MFTKRLYKLIFYVPLDAASLVKDAIFSTGAGRIGNYSHCSWETQGMGQFRPLKESNPTIGHLEELSKVDELRVEILCSKSQVNPALRALFQSHPYEEPAYELVTIQNHKFRQKR